MSENGLEIRKARLTDVDRIHAMVSTFAANALMLARSRSELYESLRDFFVVQDKQGEIIGCGGLEICWADLAEVRSLAVHNKWQRQGVGRMIVQACLQEARDLGVNRVFALTYQVDFFKRMGFQIIEKEQLPHKIWSHCLNCPKFPDCDEVAVAINLP